MRRTLLFIIIILFTAFAYAQEEDITLFQYGVKQGLSQSTVTCCLLDSNQLMWVGTSNGLNRIIGQSVVPTRFSIKSIQPVTFRSLSAENKNTLLIGSEEGAFEYSLRSGLLKKIEIPEIKNADKSRFVFALGKFRIYCSRGSDFVVENRQTGKRVNLKQTISEGARKIACTPTRLYWISPQKGEVLYFDASSETINRLYIPSNLPQDGFQAINYSPGIGISLTHNKLVAHKWNTGKWSIITISLDQLHPKAKIHSALMSYDSTVYVNFVWGGTYRFNLKSQIVSTYNSSYFNSTHQSFNLYLPTFITIELAGNVFIGTDGNGLIRINPKIRKFNYLLPTDIIGKPLNDNFVKALYFDTNGRLFFGCLNSGLMVYHLNQKIGTSLVKAKDSQEPISQIHFIGKLNKTELLLSTQMGLCIYSNNHQIRLLKGPYTRQEYTHFCSVGANECILGSAHGLYLYQFGKVKNISSKYIDQISLIQRLNKNLFIVAESGGFMYRATFGPEDTSFVPIEIESNQKPISPNYNAFIEFKSKYYVATNFGLLVLNSNFELIKIISTEDGLASNNLYSMYLGNDNQLWISSLGGICSYNPLNGKIRNFSTEYGLQSNEFNSRSSYQSANGLIFFGGVLGINYFNPKDVKTDSAQPAIYLESIQQNGKNINLDSLQKLSVLELQYHETDLSIDLKILEYTLPQNVRLEYRLFGLDHEWNKLNTSDKIRYAYLPAGKYIFQVRSYNADGICSPSIDLLKIEVKSPYYQQLWFYILLFFLFTFTLLLIFYLLYLRTARRKVKELKLLREIEQVRLQISKEIHDDIGSGLTQISFISEQLLDNDEDRTWQVTKLNKLQFLSRELIQSMSEIIWLINPINDNLERLFIYLRISINRMIEDSAFDLEIDFPKQFPEVMVKSEARRKLVLLTKESVNNALKHSKGSAISLKLQLKDDSIRFEIADNGIGMEKNTNAIGNGLNNICQNADELGLSCQFVSKNGLQIILEGSLNKITQKGLNQNY